MKEIDPGNRQGVAANVRGVIAVLMPARSMTPNEALVHAAWLVTMAEHNADFTFAEALEKVQNT